MDFTNMTASQIDLEKVKLEKALQNAQENLHKVEIAELELGKKIIELQGQRRDLQIAKEKAKQIVRTLHLDIKITESAFWNAKDNR